MPQLPHPDRQNALLEIARCVSKHGCDTGPRVAREKFPNVNAGTWCRWVKEVSGDRAKSRLKTAARMAQSIAEQIPAPGKPSASVIAEQPKAAQKALDYFEELKNLRRDIEMLRDYSTSDEGRRVKVPIFFMQQMRAKTDLLKLALHHASLAYGYEQQQKFYDAILAEVEAESPDCARRITERLSILNATLGVASSD